MLARTALLERLEELLDLLHAESALATRSPV
jgi:hypothetical protein